MKPCVKCHIKPSEKFQELCSDCLSHGNDFKYEPKTKLPETKWSKLPWNGEGLPPVGTHCLFVHGACGSKSELVDGCKITILTEITRPNGNKGVVFATDCDTDFVVDYSCCPESFKPIPTAHDIAVNELVDLMKNADLTSDQVDGSYVICAELLVNAGYRKHASLNREFSTGDTYNTDVNHWTAGIHIPGHMNAIEVYAGTQEGAELLRDEILERITC